MNAWPKPRRPIGGMTRPLLAAVSAALIAVEAGGARLGDRAPDPNSGSAGAALTAKSVAARSVVATVAPDTLSSSRVVSTSGRVVSLAADGSRVAAAVGATRAWCSHVVIWDMPRGKLASLLPPRCSSPGDASDVEAVALAGERAAWISTNQRGNYLNYDVGTATVGAPRPKWLTGDCDVGSTPYAFCTTAGDGTWATNIVGDGSLLALNGWSTCTIDPNTYPHCPEGLPRSSKASGLVDSGQILRVTPGGLRPVVSGLEALYAVSADAGRVLVLRTQPNTAWGDDIWSSAADGSLAIYRSGGRLIRTLTTSLTQVHDARLQGNHVAVLTRDSVGVVDATTGRRLRVWPLQGAKNVRLQDIHNGIVVYVAGRTIHLLRLRDGRQASVVAPGGAVRAQLEAAGLFCSYGPGRIALIPAAELTRRLSSGELK